MRRMIISKKRVEATLVQHLHPKSCQKSMAELVGGKVQFAAGYIACDMDAGWPLAKIKAAFEAAWAKHGVTLTLSQQDVASLQRDLFNINLSGL